MNAVAQGLDGYIYKGLTLEVKTEDNGVIIRHQHQAEIPPPESIYSREAGFAMEKHYTIFAARSDETNEGWIWFSNPPLHTRTIVKVHHPKTGRVVFCESRKIDSNFLAQ